MSHERVQSLLGFLPYGLYLALALLYMLAIPAGESPDEPGHLQCVEQVARLQRLPQIEPEPSGRWWSREALLSGAMCYHMPLYYLLGGALVRGTHAVTGAPLHFEFPASDPNWGQTNAMFIHEKEALFSLPLSEPPTLTALRLFSVLLGAAVIWASGSVARTLFPSRPMMAVGAATLAAGWPQFVFMSRAISNDVPAAALSALVLVILLRDVGKPRRFIWATLLAALAILTKLNMLTLGIAIAAVFVAETIAIPQGRSTARRMAHDATRRDYRLPAVIGILIFSLLFTIIALQPTLRRHALLAAASFGGIRPEALTLAYWLDVAALTLNSGWARFGWMNVPAPAWQTAVWWAFMGIGVALSIRELWREHAQNSHLRTLFAIILAVWVGSVTIGYLRINLNRFQPQFRFALALIPVLATAAAGYAGRLTRRPSRSAALIVALAVTLFAANVWLLTSIVGPTYR